jgi:Tol biopolymer transport system component
LGQEWVLMADGKEVLRLPVTNGSDLRIEFSGDDGKHLLFARSVYAGYELWVDGQKWPGYYAIGGDGSTEETIDPITSPDGAHIAYTANLDERGEKRALIVDGRVAGYLGERLQYTADSNHLICVSRTPKGQAVLIDGKPLFSGRQIIAVYVPPVGNRLAFALTHFNKDGTAAEGSFLLVDGKPVEASLTPERSISNFLFSPDGKRYAAVCGEASHRFVVIDGKKGQEYFDIDKNAAGLTQGMAFTPDSSRVVYTARATTGQFVVVNEDESDALVNAWYQYSADGKRLAYGGMVGPGGQKCALSIDGKVQPVPPGNIYSFTFSPDGTHYAFFHQQGGDKSIFLDGKNTGLNGEFAFSPDGQHLVVLGASSSDTRPGLFVDGQLVFENYDKLLLQRAFTPDSRHLIWMTQELAVGAKAAPGVNEFVVYVDAIPVVRCDSVLNAQGNLRSLYGLVTTSWQTSPAWSISSAGTLTFLGPVDDHVVRFNGTPSADTSIDTMIAEAKAAPARAAAKAAEDKKKAAEAAAAKKAQADAAAAAAAAKAKADYDAAVAKRKADYDAAVAKRKADYDAAVAAKAAKAAQQQPGK